VIRAGRQATEKQIPYGNDRQKSNDKSKGKIDPLRVKDI